MNCLKGERCQYTEFSRNDFETHANKFNPVCSHSEAIFPHAFKVSDLNC